MANNSATQNLPEQIDFEMDLEEVENFLTKELEEKFSELQLLEKERDMISNPESLGKVVLDEVWKQFGNQIGLDMTNETLIQKYDREHPEQYAEVAKSVMNDKKYKDAVKKMKEQQKSGNLKDSYTGKDLRPNDKANLDHVVSRKELFENQRRKQANLSVADLANKDENLRPTNESLNKSKNSKSVKDYLKNREQREKDLIEQNKRANKKIDESNMSDVDKRLHKAENNKRLDDKLAAKDERMTDADKTARKAIDRDIQVNAAKEIGKKAGKDALKAMAVSALFSLLKEVMNGLVRFFKEKTKSFNKFLAEMKQAIKSFFSKILSVLQTGASTLIGTIVSEIFGPIVSLFKKLASVIKQGVSSIIDAVNFLRDPKNKDKPFSVKVAQVGKIIVTGLAGTSAIFLGEVFEKVLLSVPGMQIELPMIGSLANMIGLFLSSLVSGLIGAIVLNLIDKWISKKLNEEKTKQKIEKKNEILNLQQTQLVVTGNHLAARKKNAFNDIAQNHAFAKGVMQQSLHKIFNETHDDVKKVNTITENQCELARMQRELEDLLGDD